MVAVASVVEWISHHDIILLKLFQGLLTSCWIKLRVPTVATTMSLSWFSITFSFSLLQPQLLTDWICWKYVVFCYFFSLQYSSYRWPRGLHVVFFQSSFAVTFTERPFPSTNINCTPLPSHPFSVSFISNFTFLHSIYYYYVSVYEGVCTWVSLCVCMRVCAWVCCVGACTWVCVGTCVCMCVCILTRLPPLEHVFLLEDFILLLVQSLVPRPLTWDLVFSTKNIEQSNEWDNLYLRSPVSALSLSLCDRKSYPSYLWRFRVCTTSTPRKGRICCTFPAHWLVWQVKVYREQHWLPPGSSRSRLWPLTPEWLLSVLRAAPEWHLVSARAPGTVTTIQGGHPITFLLDTWCYPSTSWCLSADTVTSGLSS